MLKQISVWSAESCRCFVFPTVAVLPKLFVSMKHVHVLMLWTVEQEQPDDKLSSHLSASLIKTESVRSEKRFFFFFFQFVDIVGKMFFRPYLETDKMCETQWWAERFWRLLLINTAARGALGICRSMALYFIRQHSAGADRVFFCFFYADDSLKYFQNS